MTQFSFIFCQFCGVNVAIHSIAIETSNICQKVIIENFKKSSVAACSFSYIFWFPHHQSTLIGCKKNKAEEQAKQISRMFGWC